MFTRLKRILSEPLPIQEAIDLAKRVLQMEPRPLYDEMADVSRFHHKFFTAAPTAPTHLTTRQALERYDFMREELLEFYDAAMKQDLADVADALVDLVYVAKGTALLMGLPWEQLWDEVQRANMDKVRGTTHRGNKVDVRKPEGWIPPQHEVILAAAGYDRQKFFTKDNYFIEDAGHDNERSSAK
jgi:predicted HAD superfamily Cof-like phosphohydrolase